MNRRMTMMGAKFRFLGTERGICFIEDLDGDISVTNDAENVWRRAMMSSLKDVTRLVYKDTQGEWWEIILTSCVNGSGPKLYAEATVEFKLWQGHVLDALTGDY